MIQPIGHFRLWRALFNKPIWLKSTLEQKVILITLMSMANFKANQWEWQGKQYNLEPGQFITSLESIKSNTGDQVSIQNIRTALKRFEKLEFLTYQSTKEGRLVTLVNWRDYQYVEGEPNIATNKDLTKTQQRPNKDLTTIEEGKKVNKVNNKNNKDMCIEIIDYLNLKTKKAFRYNAKKTIEFIDKRLSEDFTLEDFKKVIDNKTKQWLDTDNDKYLRPETLFGNKFEGYLNEKTEDKPKPLTTYRAKGSDEIVW